MPAIIFDGAAVEVFSGIPFTDAAGIQRPANWLDLASADDRAEAGVLDIVEPPAPPRGKVVSITGLSVVKGKPTRTFDLVDAPPAPSAPAFTVYKADIWRRCTDDEATKLDAEISSQPVRLRRLFDDATYLRSDDDLFGQVQGAVTQLLGADRAAAILAPSE